MPSAIAFSCLRNAPSLFAGLDWGSAMMRSYSAFANNVFNMASCTARGCITVVPSRAARRARSTHSS